LVDIVEFRRKAVSASVEPVRRPARISLELVALVIQLADFVVVLASAELALLDYNAFILKEEIYYEKFGVPVLSGAIIFILFLRWFGAYTSRRLLQLNWQVGRITLGWSLTLSALAVLAFVTKISGDYSRGWAIIWALLTFSLLLGVRIGMNYLARRWRHEGRLSQRIAIVGAGTAAKSLVAKIKATPELDIVITGVYDDRHTRVPSSILGCQVLGTSDDLVIHARKMLIDEVVIALPLRAEERIGQLVTKFRPLPIDLRISIDPIADIFPLRTIGSIGGAKTIEVFNRPFKHVSGLLKTMEDKCLGLLLLVLLSPAMALIALAIRLDSKGPLLFVQERFGFNNKIFHVYKFRTMRSDEADPSGVRHTVPNDVRVTRIGRILRWLSLDELPQLLNVMRGEMSIVGPRPHVVAMRAGDKLYYEAVGDYFARHRVKPGITGWAQVHGLRGEIGDLLQARERVAYDLEYIDNWSIWLDLKILLMTVWVLIVPRNAY
jgi:Undecaprenyl-phosphate glucose phosphotransferase